MKITNRQFRVRVNKPQHRHQTAGRAKMATLHYTLENAPENLLLLLVCEYKTKDYSQRVLHDYINNDTLCENDKISEMVAILNAIISQYTFYFTRNTTFDEQCIFADLCQIYDDKLDNVLVEIEKAVAGHLNRIHYPEKNRVLFSKIFAAGYACLLTIGIHNQMRESFPFMMFLREKMVDGEEFKQIGQRFDQMLQIMLDGQPVEMLDSQLYKVLDRKFTAIVTDYDALVEAANSVGFHFEKPTEEEIQRHNYIINQLKQ